MCLYHKTTLPKIKEIKNQSKGYFCVESARNPRKLRVRRKKKFSKYFRLTNITGKAIGTSLDKNSSNKEKDLI